MKEKIQKYRLSIQILCLVLTITSFLVNSEVATLVFLGLALLSGVFYCGWICPFGFIQEIFGKIGSLLGIKKRKMPMLIHKILVFIRYIILGLVLIIASDSIFNIMAFDPRANFLRLLSFNMITIGAIIVISFFSIVSLFYERPFCNYFCYQGARYGLFSIFRPLTIKRNESICVICKKCDNICPMNIEVSKCGNLRSPQCINCFKCITNCPAEGALSYGKMVITKNEKKKYFGTLTATVSILIIAFIVHSVFIEPKSQETATNQQIETETVPSNSDESEVITEEDTKNIGDAAGIADGVYTGKGDGFKDIIIVQITVKNEQIIAVEVTEQNDDRKWFNRAYGIIPDTIIDKQSTEVDAVSGASFSSKGIIDGVKDALNNADKK
ncbi:4Fe-4S binding protein [Vallitalea maricola]|uniref:4Fe-4S binding protein n=1 Tax=Vallitalea maricola TaxID=3074433 RepID=A0ACB5UFX6_9FIRM|nr:4Fe-4S binding protein [Vallitalea sp. AN17-2]